MIKTNILKV